MGNVAYIKEWRDRVSSNLSVPERPQKGSGDGGGDDMEQRVTRLEGQFDKMADSLRNIETTVARIEGKLDDMPTKDWTTTRLFWVVGAFVVLSGLIQVVIENVGTVPTP